MTPAIVLLILIGIVFAFLLVLSVVNAFRDQTDAINHLVNVVNELCELFEGGTFDPIEVDDDDNDDFDFQETLDQINDLPEWKS